MNRRMVLLLACLSVLLVCVQLGMSSGKMPCGDCTPEILQRNYSITDCWDMFFLCYDTTGDYDWCEDQQIWNCNDNDPYTWEDFCMGFCNWSR